MCSQTGVALTSCVARGQARTRSTRRFAARVGAAPGARKGAIGTFVSHRHTIFCSQTGHVLPNGRCAHILRSPGSAQTHSTRRFAARVGPAPGARKGAVGTFESDRHAIFRSQTGHVLTNGRCAHILRSPGPGTDTFDAPLRRSGRGGARGQEGSNRHVCEPSAHHFLLTNGTCAPKRALRSHPA